MIVVVAGTDGALPAVVAGLVEAPVIAVPTSVGYGAALQVRRQSRQSTALKTVQMYLSSGGLHEGGTSGCSFAH